MSANPGQLMSQAKQGDPKAIAALMNHSTQPKGITVKASRKGSCLQVLLEGKTVPNPGKTVEFVRDGMRKLGLDAIDRVKVYGRQVGQETPVWQDEFAIAEPPAPDFEDASDFDRPSASVDEIADENLLPDDLLEGRPSEEEEMSDTDFPDPPMGAESFLDEDDAEAYDDNLYEDEDEFADDDAAENDILDGEDDADADADAADSPSKKSSKASLGALLAVLVLVILGGGYYLYTTRPELFAGLPFLSPSETAEGTADAPSEDAVEEATGEATEEVTEEVTEETTDEATEETTEEVTAGDADGAAANPFSEAVNAATEAAQKTQTAQTQQQWQDVAQLWQTAIEQMQAVPEGNDNYDLAQQKAQEYQQNLQYAQQRAQ